MNCGKGSGAERGHTAKQQVARHSGSRWHLALPLTALIAFGLTAEPRTAKGGDLFVVNREPCELVAGPLKNRGGSGVLSKSGSYNAHGVMEQSTYRCADNSGVTVEVVFFSKGYEYAPHDVLGALLLSATRNADYATEEISAATSYVQCHPWVFEDGAQGGTICHVKIEVENDRGGSVRWFSGTSTTGFVSVGINV